MLTDSNSSKPSYDGEVIMGLGKNEVEEKMFLEVHEALQAVYSPTAVSQYEVNMTTIKILHDVFAKQKLKKNFNCEQARYYNHAAASHAAKTRALRESLESLHLPLEGFPQDCQKALTALASSAFILELKEPTLTNFLLAMNHLARESYNISEVKRKLAQQQSKLIKKFNPVLKKMDTLHKDVDSSVASLEALSTEVAKQNIKAPFIKSKIKEYEQTEKTLQKKLEMCGYEPSLNHSELVKKNEKILKLEEELNSVMKMLNSYCSLPPDENLAKLKLEEAKEELLALEEEIEKIVELRMQ